MKLDSVKFVAEISSNHNRNLDRSKKLVEEAARIGCGAVKFQLFKIDQLFAPEALAARSELRDRKNWELPLEFIPVLSNHAHEHGIEFGCTPFYLKAIDELLPYVDFYKVASYELLWSDLLLSCAKTGKPVVLSTGMATMEEIGTAFNTLQSASANDITLLHCTSAYPTPPEECNLSAIQTLKDAFKCKVGWSDHSASEGVILRAIHRFGASFVEFHFDLDKKGFEFKFGHNWLPEEMKRLIENTRTGLRADGTGEKSPVPSELSDCEWRADPSDGLRPFKSVRKRLMAGKKG